MKKLALHWKILIGMLMGILIGFALSQFTSGKEIVIDYIKPVGNIFINLLKVIAIPLIISSLIKGVADLNNISQLSKLGFRTLGLYIVSTALAVCVGLIMVNVISPGKFISDNTRTELMASFGLDAESKMKQAEESKSRGPLAALEDIVPDNIVQSASSNRNMLQVIFFVIFFGIGLILIPEEKSRTVKKFFEGVNEIVLKMIDLIMLAAPYGVFCLMASLAAEAPSIEVFQALGMYAITVLLGLGFMVFLFYPVVLKIWTGMSFNTFFKGMAPAQLLAFSTSSSAATLPVTMERVEEHLGVEKEVTSFVCPVGATVNMDGTSLYQAVAAVFIAQAFGDDLTWSEQLTIVLTATLASIGSAAVPGAGMLMLVIVLESIGVNPAGIALIFAIDRPLDMCRTVVNVSSDAAVAVLIGKSLGKLGPPREKNWDDFAEGKI